MVFWGASEGPGLSHARPHGLVQEGLLESKTQHGEKTPPLVRGHSAKTQIFYYASDLSSCVVNSAVLRCPSCAHRSTEKKGKELEVNLIKKGRLKGRDLGQNVVYNFK